MNAVGIDVSKGKSMIAIMRPLGEVVATPFEVGHTAAELNELAKFILKISGETRVVMEYTGVYFEPIARALYDAGLCVCVVHAQLIHNYGNNTIRKVKTDKADAIKIANYALDNWNKLKPYKGEILGLQWKDIDFDEGIIHITKQFTRQFNKDTSADNSTVLGLSEPKTKFSIRDVYMFDSFAKELKAYKDKMIEWKKENRFNHSEEDFVFVGTKNKPIEPRIFYKYYQEVMEIAGIEDANFHTLRHTFTTRCIENGMDILMVSRTLGHSNISTTLNKYSHLLPKHQKACMEKLEAIYY